MAIIKHIPSENADYNAAIDYLMYQHDELSGKMLRDNEGRPVVREDFLMDGINCEPFEYPMAAMETNRLYGKNAAKGDVKSHHYVLSFDPRDADVGLAFDEAHRMASASRANGSAATRASSSRTRRATTSPATSTATSCSAACAPGTSP